MYYYLQSLSASTQHVVPSAVANPNNIPVPISGRGCSILSADRDGSCQQFQCQLDVCNQKSDLPVAESYLPEDDEISLSSSIAASECTSSGMEMHSGVELNDVSASQAQLLVTVVCCILVIIDSCCDITHYRKNHQR